VQFNITNYRQEQMNKNLLFLLEEEIFAPASFGERKGRKC